MVGSIDFSKLDLQDALDIAILIEEEAYERYIEFAEQIGFRYKDDASDFFLMMAQAEAKHGKQLYERRTKLFGKAPVRVRREQIFDVEAPEYTDAHPFMSPRRALEIAYHGEQKAYEFFTAALPQIHDPEVKALFEELQEEEIHHQQMLQELMPRYGEGSAEPDVDPEDVDTPDL